MNSLWVILEEITDTRSNQELTERQKEQLRPLVEACQNVLHDLYKTLNKYRDLDNDSKSLGQKSRVVWKRLRYEPDDIRELRSRISSTIGILNAFNQDIIR